MFYIITTVNSSEQFYADFKTHEEAQRYLEQTDAAKIGYRIVSQSEYDELIVK